MDNLPPEPSPVTQPKPITEKRFLVVEGKDDERFFRKLLKHMGISGCQVERLGGRDCFNASFPAFKQRTGFGQIEMLAVVRDADDQGVQNSFDSVTGTLERNDLEVPSKPGTFSTGKPRTGVFIVDDGSGKGMLEDLCLRTVKSHPAIPCVEKFTKCVETLGDPPQNLSKTRAQAFLAAMPRIVNSIGLGADKHYWDLDSPELKSLKLFLWELR